MKIIIHIEKRTENSDRINYIPNIIVFKLDGENIEIIKDYKDWYNINVICCAAHNQKEYKVEFEKLKIINYNKIKDNIECSVENNIDNLILGAFGCGVFANPPELISKTFKKILIDEEYYKYFELFFLIQIIIKIWMNLIMLLKILLKIIIIINN